MIIKDKKVNVYDIEIFPNCFHCTVKDTENNILYKFEISERKNQLSELINYFYYNSSDILFCGYNWRNVKPARQLNAIFNLNV